MKMITKLVLLYIVSSVTSQSLHQSMSPEDLSKVFSVKSIDKVPPYDVLPVSITKPRNKRMVNTYLVEIPFGNHIKMWLNPVYGILAGENLTVSSARYNPYSYDNLDLRDRPSVKPYISAIYENTFHATTVAVNNYSGGKQYLKGFIGNKFIQPVPSHLMDHAKRHRRSLNQSIDHESEDQMYHIVYDIPQPMNYMNSLPIKVPYQTNSTRSKRYAVPEIIYPEILVIVERSLMKLMGETPDQQLLYVLAFWNGVDMRYRTLANPRVRLNIARIVFAEDDDVLSYLRPRNNRYFWLNEDSSLRNHGDWLFEVQQKIPLHSYDLAVTMLPHLMCANNHQACGVLGFAFISGACVVDYYRKTTNKVAYALDRGGYDGIQTAAHELGHLFGIEHDGEKNDCYDEHGYIMTRWDKFTPQAFDWSPCSLQHMDSFLKSGKGRCLYNRPYYDKPFHRYLPGKLLDANRQCKVLRGGHAFVINDSICTQLKCTGYNTDVRLPEAAEGTPCGQNKLCLHGKCIHENYVV